MVVGILFLHGAVESFTVGVLFGCTRPSLVVREVEFRDHLSKMLLELRAIVSEDVPKGEREYVSHDVEEFFRSDGSMRGGAEAVAKAGVQVNERNDVSPRPIDVLLEGVEGNTVPWVASGESMRLPVGFEACNGSDATGPRDALWHHAQSAEVFEYPADRLFLGTSQFLRVAILFEQWVQLLFPQILMFEAEPLDFLDDPSVPQTTSLHLGSLRFGVEAFELPFVATETLLP